MAAKNIVITNGSITETTYNSDKIEQQISAGVTSHTGDSTISGGLTVGSDLSVSGKISGGEIVETSTGFSYEAGDIDWTPEYVGAVKNGNKVTFVLFGRFTKTTSGSVDNRIAILGIPSSVGSKLYPYTIGTSVNNLDNKVVNMFSGRTTYVDCVFETAKQSNGQLFVYIRNTTNLDVDVEYVFRYEVTFLLSDSLVTE